jgi:hypothetical protein
VTADFCSNWTPCSREWFADLAAYRATTGETPVTDAIIASDTGDSSIIANLAKSSRKFERDRAALLAALEELVAVVADMPDASRMPRYVNARAALQMARGETGATGAA